jgi:isochorismate pyruvate lyase
MPFRPLLASVSIMIACANPAGAADSTQPALWGTPGAAGGSCCATLREVRENIDRIDRELIRLMAERGEYVREAARFKPHAAAVHDAARVEQIIAKVRALASEAKLAPEIAERTYRTMIGAFEEHERKVFQSRQ